MLRLVGLDGAVMDHDQLTVLAMEGEFVNVWKQYDSS